jgi:hypothetical protein
VRRRGVALDPSDKRMVSELRESERAGLLKIYCYYCAGSHEAR